VPPEMVLPLIVVVVLFVALLIAYPWQVLTIGTICYIAALPMSWLSYCEHQRLDAVQLASQAPVNVDIDQTMPPEPPRDPDRPARLN
jgi:CDP-diacylglycerol---serine O-phosphatidyltransferase